MFWELWSPSKRPTKAKRRHHKHKTAKKKHRRKKSKGKQLLNYTKKEVAKRVALALKENGWHLTTPATPPYMNAEKGERDVSIFFQKKSYKVIVGKGDRVLKRKVFRTYNGLIGFIERLR